jgi:UDP-N-acetyl-alpha-D-muramoyl-L-alanyl-L-glutamate epimerase
MTDLLGRGQVFRYLGFTLDPAARQLTCDYAVDGRRFREKIVFPGGGDWAAPAVTEAARLVFLLAGVSYYKTAVPPVIDLGDHAVTDRERDFLRSFYIDGLGEFAYRSDRLGWSDLHDLRIVGPSAKRTPATYLPKEGRPLVPFGGGVDSITTVDLVAERATDTALFILNRPGDRFEAIERPAAITGLPIVRAERTLDDQVLRSRELGFFNGHIPVTGILSSIAVMAAVLEGRDAVVMSNEWSASSPTVVVDGYPINHQYSKSMAFETGLREYLAGAIGNRLAYFSALRPFTELRIARRFAQLPDYHGTFRSCNRAFHIDSARRLDYWCGECDKCCFIDLILAPFLDEPALRRIFHDREPLANPALLDKFDSLIGLSRDTKPWECVGDVTECQAATLLAAQRPDRAGNRLLAALAGKLREQGIAPPVDELMNPVGTHFIPRRYAADDLLV